MRPVIRVLAAADPRTNRAALRYSSPVDAIRPQADRTLQALYDVFLPHVAIAQRPASRQTALCPRSLIDQQSFYERSSRQRKRPLPVPGSGLQSRLESGAPGVAARRPASFRSWRGGRPCSTDRSCRRRSAGSGRHQSRHRRTAAPCRTGSRRCPRAPPSWRP
jgi:hypothetical protein